jgi:SAM-dependent methyltransferase
MDKRTVDILLDIHRGLPKQAPGDRDSTLRALALCEALPDAPDILDIGCGPGFHSLVLAEASGGQVTGIDVFDVFLDELAEKVDARGLSDQIHPVNASMEALPFDDASFDLIWAEGSAYIMGFDKALERWRPLLRDGGYIAVSELVWLDDEPDEEVVDFWASEYPAMTDVDSCLAMFDAADYERVGHFTLPDSAWWENYYDPLEARLPEVRTKYADDADALEMVEATQREIDIRRAFGDAYGYAFFVARV